MLKFKKWKEILFILGLLYAMALIQNDDYYTITLKTENPTPTLIYLVPLVLMIPYIVFVIRKVMK